MSDPLIKYELEGEVALIGLNRAEKRNAISEALLDDFEGAIARASNEAGAAVVYGVGQNFCSGLDLAEHVHKSPAEGLKVSRRWHVVFDGMQRGAIPFIAAMTGAVVGGGLEMAAATHVRVADTTAFFALPEGQRGIFIGGGGSVRITRLATAARVMDMMLTGRVLSAEEGERANLVQYVVPKGTALEKAKALATAAASNAPLSNFAIIHALPRIQDMAHDDGLFVESLVASLTQTSPEAAERLRGFLEKRTAKISAPNRP